MRERVMNMLPNDPNNKTNDWDKEAKKGKGKTQEKAQRPAITIWITHNFYEFF